MRRGLVLIRLWNKMFHQDVQCSLPGPELVALFGLVLAIFPWFAPIWPHLCLFHSFVDHIQCEYIVHDFLSTPV